MGARGMVTSQCQSRSATVCWVKGPAPWEGCCAALSSASMASAVPGAGDWAPCGSRWTRRDSVSLQVGSNEER